MNIIGLIEGQTFNSLYGRKTGPLQAKYISRILARLFYSEIYI